MSNLIFNTTIGAAPQITTAPTYSGTVEVGQTVTATEGTETGDGTITTTWQWLRNGVAISEATNSSYTIVSADEGTQLSVRQTATSIYGVASRNSAQQTVSSDTGNTVIISGVPTISGTPEVGETLTASAATSTGDEPITTTWQWLRNGSDISGETSQTYVVQAEDEFQNIAVRQTDSNSIPSSDSAISASVTIGVPTIEYQLLTVQEDSATGSTGSGTISYDLTGDWDIIVFTGGSDKTESLSFDGVDVPIILPENIPPTIPDDYPSGGHRLAVAKTTLTGLTGAGTINYTVEFSSSDGTYPIGAVAVKNGDLQPVTNDNWKFSGTGDTITFNSIEVPTNGAFLLGASLGRATEMQSVGGETYPAWTTLDQQGIITNDGTNEGLAIAWAADQFASYYDEAVETSSLASDKICHAFLAFTPKNATSPAAVPQAWTLENEASVTGDIAKVDVQTGPFLLDHVVNNYELEIQKSGGTVVERVLGGDATNYVRRHRMDTNTTTTCRLRAIFTRLSDAALITGGWSDPKNVTTTTGSPSITLEKSVSGDIYLGEAIVFSVNDESGFDLISTAGDSKSLRKPMHELDYYIDQDDVTEEGNLERINEVRYTNFFPNIERSQSRCRRFAFAPQTTGTKTFTATVTDLNGNSATDTASITVVDPQSVIADGDTYVYSSTSDWTGTPAGANRYTDWATFVAAIEEPLLNGTSSGQRLVYIHDDEVVGDGTQIPVYGLDEFHVRNYGGGTNLPSLDHFFYVQCGRASIYGIDLDKGYDPRTYPGDATSGVGFRPSDGFDLSNCGTAGLANCGVRGGNINYFAPAPGNAMAIFDCLSGGEGINGAGWANFGLFADNMGTLAVHGMKNTQAINTIRAEGTKGETDPPVFSDHGPQRSSRPKEDIGISRMLNYSANSWGSGESVQPNFRMFGSGFTPAPIGIHIVECVTEGVTFPVSDSSRAGGIAASTPQDVVIDGLVHLIAHGAGSAFIIRMGGTTLKNLLCIVSSQKGDVRPDGFRRFWGFQSEFLGDYPPKDNWNHPIRIINGTFVDLSFDTDTDSDFFDLFAIDGDDLVSATKNKEHQDVEFIQCVSHAPNFSTSTTTFDPLNNTALGHSAFYQQKTFFDGVSVTEDTTFHIDDSALCLWNVESGSSGFETASSPLTPRRDGRGVLRGASPSLGWLEPI